MDRQNPVGRLNRLDPLKFSSVANSCGRRHPQFELCGARVPRFRWCSQTLHRRQTRRLGSCQLQGWASASGQWPLAPRRRILCCPSLLSKRRSIRLHVKALRPVLDMDRANGYVLRHAPELPHSVLQRRTRPDESESHGGRIQSALCTARLRRIPWAEISFRANQSFRQRDKRGSGKLEHRTLQRGLDESNRQPDYTESGCSWQLLLLCPGSYGYRIHDLHRSSRQQGYGGSVWHSILRRDLNNADEWDGAPYVHDQHYVYYNDDWWPAVFSFPAGATDVAGNSIPAPAPVSYTVVGNADLEAYTDTRKLNRQDRADCNLSHWGMEQLDQAPLKR